MAESEEKLKSLFMRVKEDSETASLNLNSQKAKIMGWGPIRSWQTAEDKVKMVTDFIFLGSKITVHDDCRYDIKICLLLEWKVWQT